MSDRRRGDQRQRTFESKVSAGCERIAAAIPWRAPSARFSKDKRRRRRAHSRDTASQRDPRLLRCRQTCLRRRAHPPVDDLVRPFIDRKLPDRIYLVVENQRPSRISVARRNDLHGICLNYRPQRSSVVVPRGRNVKDSPGSARTRHTSPASLPPSPS